MAFGFARRRHDEVEPRIEKTPADSDPLARFAYVETDDEVEPSHSHDGHCRCGLRGE